MQLGLIQPLRFQHIFFILLAPSSAKVDDQRNYNVIPIMSLWIVPSETASSVFELVNYTHDPWVFSERLCHWWVVALFRLPTCVYVYTRTACGGHVSVPGNRGFKEPTDDGTSAALSASCSFFTSPTTWISKVFHTFKPPHVQKFEKERLAARSLSLFVGEGNEERFAILPARRTRKT